MTSFLKKLLSRRPHKSEVRTRKIEAKIRKSEDNNNNGKRIRRPTGTFKYPKPLKAIKPKEVRKTIPDPPKNRSSRNPNCSHCDFKTKDRWRMIMHFKEEHSLFYSMIYAKDPLKRQFRCPEFFSDKCKFITEFKSDLTEHVRRKHFITGEKKFRCGVCWSFRAHTRQQVRAHIVDFH